MLLVLVHTGLSKMVSPCENCKKRDTCTEVCKLLETQLPGMRHGLPLYKKRLTKGDALFMQKMRQRAKNIVANLSRLSPREEKIASLFYVDGFCIAEIAFIEEVTVKSVKSYLYRIRKQYG